MVAGLRAREGLLRVLGRASAQFHEGFALARLGGFLGHGGVQPLFRSRVGGVFSIPRGGSDGRWCVRGAQTGGTECTDTPQTAHAPQSARVPHPGCSSLRLTCLRGPSDSRVLVSSASSSAEGSDSSPLELAAAMSLRRASQCSTITRASEGSSVQKVEVKVWSLIKSNHVRHPLLKKYSHRSCSSSSTSGVAFSKLAAERSLTSVAFRSTPPLMPARNAIMGWWREQKHVTPRLRGLR
mmetsp:Transcript_69005/g.192845  ORF Transcript_69005/g.192845 Transcript_69005/m.192845 type:complete len:239 (+) Transcript_69005:316-1032(+)